MNVRQRHLRSVVCKFITFYIYSIVIGMDISRDKASIIFVHFSAQFFFCFIFFAHLQGHTERINEYEKRNIKLETALS
jgi:hypothetical protein